MEKLVRLWGLIAAQLALPAEDRDENALQKHMHEYSGLVNSDEVKNSSGAGDVGGLKSAIDQLQRDLAAETEARRNVERMGLAVRQNRIVVPGLSARIDLLNDRRLFADPEQAKRYGAHVAACLARTSKVLRYESLPKYTREVAESVQKDADSFGDEGLKAATPDITPSSGTGLELMSNEFRSDMIAALEVYGRLFTECSRVPLTTMGTTTWPRELTELTAYWTAVAAEIQKSGFTFDTVSMQPEELAGLTAIPNQMMMDPRLLVDLGNFVGLGLVRAIGRKLDDSVANGDASASYGGITGFLVSATIAAVTAAAGNTTVALIDGDDLDEFIAGLTLSTAHENAQWFLSLSSLMKHLSIKDPTTKQYIYRRADDRGKEILNGYRVHVAQILPAAASVGAATKYGAFGDLQRAYYVGMIRNIEIAASEDVWFPQNMTGIRGIVYADAAEAASGCLVTLKTHA